MKELVFPIYIYTTAAFCKELWSQETLENGIHSDMARIDCPSFLARVSFMCIMW